MPHQQRPDIAAIRERLRPHVRCPWWGVTQKHFAELLNVPVGTIRDWEHGRRKPDAAGQALLDLMDAAPAEMLAAGRKAAKRRAGIAAVP